MGVVGLSLETFTHFYGSFWQKGYPFLCILLGINIPIFNIFGCFVERTPQSVASVRESDLSLGIYVCRKWNPCMFRDFCVCVWKPNLFGRYVPVYHAWTWAPREFAKANRVFASNSVLFRIGHLSSFFFPNYLTHLCGKMHVGVSLSHNGKQKRTKQNKKQNRKKRRGKNPPLKDIYYEQIGNQLQLKHRSKRYNIHFFLSLTFSLL